MFAVIFIQHCLLVCNQSVSLRAFVVFSNGKNGTIGRQIPFKVLPMVPLVIPLDLGTSVTNIRQQMMQTEYSVGNSTNTGKLT